MLMSQFSQKRAELWEQHEICLLVSEDIIRKTLGDRLRHLHDRVKQGSEGAKEGNVDKKTSGPSVESSDTVFSRFCASVQDMVQYSLLHGKFEIRRVITQLLPSLVRYLCVFEPNLLFKVRANACVCMTLYVHLCICVRH